MSLVRDADRGCSSSHHMQSTVEPNMVLGKISG